MEGAKDELRFVEVAPAGGTPRRSIAFRRRLPRGAGALRPGIVFLGGFASDMRGSKASFLDEWAQREGRALLRFDYSGHGESGGRFEDGAIGDWLEDSLAAFDAATEGPQILVGTSMGGWIALLLTQRLAATGRRPHALVLIAPAVDFTEELLWASADAEARRAILQQGVWPRPSRYAPHPTPITRRLVEEGRAHLLLGGLIRTHAPVTILQGMQDEDVPYAHALRLVERLPADPVSLSLIVDGDHRLSRRQDLDHLVATIEALG
ncbi:MULTISPECIES: alpha/beta hydrolase [Methylosinus]|uniref:Alpha/beta hydrolase n=1 Tax=Methylosinus trichosporium (strain ATCC 35070 / NCIMB 11131 / UNIQEM 75 / OB3b) TaxID=595536 RepID=A0A2D2D629_METT3|nr:MULTISPECIES: alpha/beta fold hydrolase [Methylosinus]ATQ70432.1 alpha/beta hydrolase [Methylosinus trichosporium OB3b]